MCPPGHSICARPVTLYVPFVSNRYAALAVERMLSLKDKGKLRFSPADLGALLQVCV